MYVLLIFSISNLVYSSLVSSYKLLALSAGTSNFGFFFIFFTSLDSCIWKLDFTYLNSILWTILYKSLSNWFKFSFFGGVLTDFNLKLVVISSLSLPCLSKKNVFHLILIIKLSKEYFDKAAPAYNNALKTSGFNENIQFMSKLPSRRNRNRQIIWFNPPYSVNVKTNINRIFLRLIDKHFPQHKYHKLFNRKNIKISYSCLPKMASVILNHDTSLLKDPTPTDIKECNCHQKTECPLDKKCLTGYLVYNALVWN